MWAQIIQKMIQGAIVSREPKYVSAYSRYREQLRENPLRVFIAYDSDDETKVRDLYLKLKNKTGISPWLDRESEIKDIDRGARAEWEPKLKGALQEADCAIICLSRESIANRSYFHKEEVPFILKAAKKPRELSVYVILVKLEECTAPPKYRAWPVTEVYREGQFEKLLDTVVINAYEELKLKRGVAFQSPL